MPQHSSIGYEIVSGYVGANMITRRSDNCKQWPKALCCIHVQIACRAKHFCIYRSSTTWLMLVYAATQMEMTYGRHQDGKTFDASGEGLFLNMMRSTEELLTEQSFGTSCNIHQHLDFQFIIFDESVNHSFKVDVISMHF